jgi:hypothetical protein
VSKRHRIVTALERYLERHGWPRFQMTLIVAVTGLVWFLSGYLLLRAGLRVICFRYVASLGCSYVAFICLVWIWLRWERSCLARPGGGKPPKLEAEPGDGTAAASPLGRMSPGDIADAVDAASNVGEVVCHAAESLPSAAEGTGSAGDLAAGAASADCEGCLVIIVGGVVLSAFAAAIYVIYIAPTLLAEVLLDGALSVGLRKRIGRIDDRHWLESAIAQTWFPFVVMGLILFIGGAIIQSYAKHAATLGEVLQYVRAAKNM